MASEARDAAIGQLTDDVAAMGAARLVLELDDSVAQNDRRIVYEHLRKTGLYSLRYDHMRASSECLLALPDALAWSWCKGGPWSRLAKELTTEVIQL